MHYVKQFSINGVDTKQVACIELQGKPNAATEGYVGVLGIDMISPLHEVYKCVAVNGSIYTWELLSSGMSTLTSTTTGNGEESFLFPYSELKIPSGYLIKRGDLIIDSEGYLYQIESISVDSCSATYCGTQFLKGDQGEPGVTPTVGDNGNWWIGDTDTGVPSCPTLNIEYGSYVGTGTYGADNPTSLTFSFEPKFIYIATASSTRKNSNDFYSTIYGSKRLFLIYGNEETTYANNDSFSKVSASWDGTTVNWSSDIGVDQQMNGLETTYRYMAIGEQYGMESINAALDELHSYARSLVGGDTV